MLRSNVLNIEGVNFMAVENSIDPLVSMQQELCDMWGINNQKSMYFIMMKVIIAESFGLMIVSSSLIRIIQLTLCWQG